MPIIGVVFSFMQSLDRYHFLFLDDFEGNVNISVVIKSGPQYVLENSGFTSNRMATVKRQR